MFRKETRVVGGGQLTGNQEYMNNAYNYFCVHSMPALHMQNTIYTSHSIVF